MATPTIFLFDIDGTLVHCGGAGREAMGAGFDAVTGRRGGLTSVRFAGGTDRAIVREGLVGAGLAADESIIDAVLEAYLERLPRALEEAGGVRLLPGVARLLDGLGDGAGHAVGLGTGNVRGGAMLKLEAVGLSPRFGFGGFGSDAEDRAELLEIAARRGAARLGRARSDCAVVVLGDTPRDVAAARAIGARCLAVATGGYTVAELAHEGPDRVAADLLDREAMRFLQAMV